MTWGMIGGAAVATVGGALLNKGGSSQSGTQTQTTQQQMDPRLQALLYGDGSAGSSGLAQQIAAQSQQGQTGGLKNFGAGMDSYLNGWGTDNFMRSQQAAQKLQETTNAAPLAQSVPGVETSLSTAAQVNAPSQNSIDLSPTFQSLLSGNAASNPYLTQALQSGVDQTNTAYQKNQTDLTNNLQRNILPGINSNAILSGGFGGSRQGIAQGNAISDYTNQLGSNNLALAQANSANTTGAQAQAYNQAQDRALSAAQGLSAQQYGVAGQNASYQQQSGLANQAAAQSASSQNNQLAQQTTLANQQATLANNAQNDARNIAGTGLSSGLLGQAYGYGTNNQTADYTKLLQGTGALGGLAGYGGTSTSSSPLYSNTAGNLLGGASAGLGLYNQFKNGFGSSTSTPSSATYSANDWFTS